MTVTIGDKTFNTRRPRDLDQQLLAETGCTAAEIAGQLGGSPLAGTVARALMPFLAEGDRPAMAELATLIESAGTHLVAREVAAIYGVEAEPEKPAPSAEKAGKDSK